MTTHLGLRDRKKRETRQRIADVAATLFAELGYDAVSMVEVARAADVSDQTVYNYFAAKQDLVLDRADEIRGWYDRAIRERAETVSPAQALQPFLMADIDRYRTADLDSARGEFLAQSIVSPTLRRFVLQERERQVLTLSDALVATTPNLPVVTARIHAAGLIALVQHLHDQIGSSVLDRVAQDLAAEQMQATAQVGFADLTRAFVAHPNAAIPPPPSR